MLQLMVVTSLFVKIEVARVGESAPGKYLSDRNRNLARAHEIGMVRDQLSFWDGHATDVLLEMLMAKRDAIRSDGVPLNDFHKQPYPVVAVRF